MKSILVATALSVAAGYGADNYWNSGHHSAQVSEQFSKMLHHVQTSYRSAAPRFLAWR